MMDAAASERVEFLHPAPPFPMFRAGLFAGIFAGCVATSALTTYMGNMADRQERARLAAEVRKCAGDYVRLESGRHICRTPMFWRKIQPSG